MELYTGLKRCVPPKARERDCGLTSTAFAQIVSAGSLIAASSVPELGMLRGVGAMLFLGERSLKDRFSSSAWGNHLLCSHPSVLLGVAVVRASLCLHTFGSSLQFFFIPDSL